VGQWLNDKYPERSTFRAVIDRVLYGGVDNTPSGLISIAPNQSETDLRIGLHQLCYGTEAKFGCYLLLIIVFDLKNSLEKSTRTNFFGAQVICYLQHLLD